MKNIVLKCIKRLVGFYKIDVNYTTKVALLALLLKKYY